MSTKRYRIGIIGYGGFGSFLHRAWSGMPDATVVAISDKDPGNLDGIDLKLLSVEELLNRESVDIVSVATPPDTHAPIADKALRRGIHVVIEKPVSTNLEEARGLLQSAQASEARITIDFMLRYNPLVAYVHEACRDGRFGKLQRVSVENYAQDESLPRDHWFWNSDVSGGILREHAVHFIDLVDGCTQAEVARINTHEWSREDGRTDRVAIDVHYSDGLVSSQYHAFNRLQPFERTTMRFVFDAAQIDLSGWIPTHGRIIALTDVHADDSLSQLPGLEIVSNLPLKSHRTTALQYGEGTSEVHRIVEASFQVAASKEEAYLEALRALMRDFLGSIETGREPRVTLRDGVRSLFIASGRDPGRRGQ